MQRSFDDLGTPLCDVTFCIVDLETTGGSPLDDTITEIGAVKVRGGQVLGTYQTLVNPGRAIPPEITILTGITAAMVVPAPRIEEVLPSFVEFAAGTVLVGHNVRFDRSFLNAALRRAGWAELPHQFVDTAPLARRLVRDEVPNCRLGTLASRLRLDHQPSHRALDDALATCDLLHFLLERAASFGVLGLDDLIALPRLGAHPQVAKLRLTNALPRTPGVYLFTGPRGEVLYVGKATNLRQRVRSYFSGDDRRKIGPLLREAQGVRHIECATVLEAAVTEVRLIRELQPRYNREAKRWSSYTYVKLTREPYPRLAVVRQPTDDGALYLGPLRSTATAQLVVEAIHTAVPLRRCTARVRAGQVVRDTPCTAGQLGVAACPCAGGIDEASYRRIVTTVERGLTTDPELLLGPLRDRMLTLAADERFEEAADVRDRAAALARALRRQQSLDSLRAAGTLLVRLTGGGGAEVCRGVLVASWAGPSAPVVATLPPELPPASGPVPRHLADEMTCVARWLDEHAGRLVVEHCDGGLALPSRPVPSFEPAGGVATARR